MTLSPSSWLSIFLFTRHLAFLRLTLHHSPLHLQHRDLSLILIFIVLTLEKSCDKKYFKYLNLLIYPVIWESRKQNVVITGFYHPVCCDQLSVQLHALKLLDLTKLFADSRSDIIQIAGSVLPLWKMATLTRILTKQVILRLNLVIGFNFKWL